MAVNVALAQSVTFRDAKGMVARVSFYVGGNTPDANYPKNPYTDASHIVSDLASMTNAAEQVARGVFEFTPGTVVYGASGVTYQDVEDKAMFVFQDASGGLHRYQLPAPRAALFLADGETVDNGNALVKQFVADMLNQTFGGTAPTAGASNGAYTRAIQPLTSYVGGIRLRRKLHRKFNIWTLNPQLVTIGE